jgi:hypothetical protein
MQVFRKLIRQEAALRVPLKCPSPQHWLDDHGDELELRQADQNPLAFPVSGTRPQSRSPTGGTGRSLETRPLGCGPAANWSGPRHSDTVKIVTSSVVEPQRQAAALHRVDVICPVVSPAVSGRHHRSATHSAADRAAGPDVPPRLPIPRGLSLPYGQRSVSTDHLFWCAAPSRNQGTTLVVLLTTSVI